MRRYYDPHMIPTEHAAEHADWHDGDVEPSEREQCRGRIMARDAEISRLTNRITALKVEQGADKALLAKLEGERHGRGRKPHHAD